jgi:hypothetical protein
VLPAHDVVKGHISTSEDVPMHSLAYRLPRIHLLGTSVNKGMKKGQSPTEAGLGPLEELPAYPDGCSMTPSCCIMPN